MATTRFPDPITNLYNPSAWALVDVAETGAVGNFIDFPEAQDEPITFPNTILTDTITGTTNATAMTIGGTTNVGSITIGSTLNAGDKLVLGSAASTTTIAGTLKTPSITSTGNMTVAPPTLSTMTIANAAKTTLFVGEGVRDGTGGNTVNHRYSGGNDALLGNSVTLNNGTQNQSTTFIQCGAGTSGTRSTGNVEIKTGFFNSGEVRIGQFTTDSNKTTTVIKGDVNLVTLKGIDVSTAMTIGSNITTGSIVIGSALQAGDKLTLGSSATATTVNGTLKSDSISGSAVSSTMTIGNNITSGNINIGTSISSGDHILIGSSTAGSRVVVDGALVSNKIEGSINSSAMTIGNNITTGTIKIGENIENPGTILLGNAATGTSPQITNIVQVQGRFQSNFLRTKTTNGALAIADDQSAGGTVAIGSSLTESVTTNAKQIIQNLSIPNSLSVQNVVGNSNSVTSYSMNFNRKDVNGAGSFNVFRLLTAAVFYSQYFELTVLGSNSGRGSYYRKTSFLVSNDESVMNVYQQSSSAYARGSPASPVLIPPIFTFTIDSVGQLTIGVATDTQAGFFRQTYVATLIALPSENTGAEGIDFAVTAL